MTSTHTDCSLPMHTLAASSASAANRKASAPLSGTEQKLKLSAAGVGRWAGRRGDARNETLVHEMRGGVEGKY